MEEEFELARMQLELNSDADWLGLDYLPFPRPEEPNEEINLD